MATEQGRPVGGAYRRVLNICRPLTGVMGVCLLGAAVGAGLALYLAHDRRAGTTGAAACAELKARGIGCFVLTFGPEEAPSSAETVDRPARRADPAPENRLARSAGAPSVRADTRGAARADAAPSRIAARPGGTYGVQVGAFFTRREAEHGWQRVERAANGLLADLRRQVVEADLGKDTVYRLRAGPVPDRAAGGDLCAKLEARGVSCFVVALTRGAPPPVITERPSPNPRPGALQVALKPDAWRGAARKPSWHWRAPRQVIAYVPAREKADRNRGDGHHVPAAKPIRRAAAGPVKSYPRGRARMAMSDILYRKVNELAGYPARGRAYTEPRRTQADRRARRNPGDPANQIASLGLTDSVFTRAQVQTAQSQDNDPTLANQSDDVEDESRLSDEPSPFLGEGDIPDRPPLLLEIGDPFLDTGELDVGFELPTGAVWQPRLWVFGTLRTSAQTIDTGNAKRTSEWVNRLDLFANLQLTGTEKIVLGFRPFDENQPDKFSGYRFEPSDDKGFQNNLSRTIRTLFAEGDFGSLFPNLDPEGQTLLDFGFTVGRQPLIFQDGILISDTQDTIGLVRNNIRLPGVSNLRIAGVYSSDIFNETTRSAGGIPLVESENLQLTGLFTEWDTRVTTINLDGIYVWDDSQSDGNGFYAGISAAQRIGEFNTTFRANGSLAQNDESVLVRDGLLLSSELSWTPYGTNDTAYFNPFIAFGEFLQAAREEIDGGGPLAPIGILFASPNIGEYGSEMVNRANDVVGVALGYQAFWDDNRRNLAIEFAMRRDLGLDNRGDPVLDGFDQYGLGFQLQQAIGQRLLVQLEGYGVLQEDRDEAYGGRLEFLYQF